MLYNFFDDGGYIGIVFYSLLMCFMVGIIISMIVPVVRMVFSNRNKIIYTELIVRLTIMLIPIVLAIFVCSQFVQLTEYYCDYVTEKYDVISGNHHELLTHSPQKMKTGRLCGIMEEQQEVDVVFGLRDRSRNLSGSLYEPRIVQSLGRKNG